MSGTDLTERRLSGCGVFSAEPLFKFSPEDDDFLRAEAGMWESTHVDQRPDEILGTLETLRDLGDGADQIAHAISRHQVLRSPWSASRGTTTRVPSLTLGMTPLRANS